MVNNLFLLDKKNWELTKYKCIMNKLLSILTLSLLLTSCNVVRRENKYVISKQTIPQHMTNVIDDGKTETVEEVEGEELTEHHQYGDLHMQPTTFIIKVADNKRVTLIKTDSLTYEKYNIGDIYNE